MDEPGWSWPAWKFGMKREALFTKLHDQYNTFPSSIQDPEAFHHDVYEISNTASTTDEFHRLLADRREQRLFELNDGLKAASVEIIANPKLIGTRQWQYAIQLFQTKSLDSIVRYFSSYLPDDHPWHKPQHQTSSTDDAITNKAFFDNDYLTDEPLVISTSIPASHLPPSPRSLTMCSDSSSVSLVDIADHEYALDTLTPARTLSFSEPELDVMANSGILSIPDHDEYETSQPDESDTPATSISDISESYHQHETSDEPIAPAECGEDSVEPSVESDTPTPRNEVSDSCTHTHDTTNSSKSLRRPSSPLYTHVLHEYVRSSRRSRRDGSPGWYARRRSPEVGRVQKPSPDPLRVRPKGRRREQ